MSRWLRQKGQALGRSRGGFWCKIHLKTDFNGLSIGFHLTGGEVSDITQLERSLDIGPDIKPRAAMTNKGYDSKTNRSACRKRGIVPVIPYRSNAKNRPTFFPHMLYKGRTRIEQSVGKLKRFKLVAFRCEKTAESFASIVAFACSMILVKSVHRPKYRAGRSDVVPIHDSEKQRPTTASRQMRNLCFVALVSEKFTYI